MAIKMVEDFGAPIAVTAIDLITEEVAPDYNQYAAYAMTAIGYIGAFLGYGGDFVKQVGVASLPLSARSIRDLIKGKAAASNGEVTKRINFRPGGGSIQQTVFDDYANVRVS